MLHVTVALIAWIYASLLEYAIHRYVFHGIGKKRSSRFSFHWHEHHSASRRNGMLEDSYVHRKLAWNGYTRELGAMAFLVVVHLPLLFVLPTAWLAMAAWAVTYHWVHHRTHVDPAWAREHCSWHYDHHMAPNMDANFGVTSDWMDHLFGTREPFVGTEREARKRRRRAA